MKDDCYNCEFFMWYGHFTENVYCSMHRVVQFGFGERYTCSKFKQKQNDSSKEDKK